MYRLILIELLAVSVLANTHLTTTGHKLSTGWRECDKNSPLQMRCSADCEHIEYCTNGRTFTVSCMEQTGKRYCDMETNSCKDYINVCYNSRDSCPSPGIYPDLNNCQRYVYCSNETVYPYECDYGTIWDYKTGLCKENISCQTYTRETGCSNTTRISVVAHQNPRWFVFCNTGHPLLAQCPGKFYTFDVAKGNCRFQCEHQNLNHNKKFVDEKDPSTYYECYNIGGEWKTNVKRCPKGTYFDQQRQICGIFQNNSDQKSTELPKS